MQQTDVIIIGAGAAGLMAAMHLSRAGKKVVVLEARNRIGGRIDTWQQNGFNQPTELGAEFVHGQLPVTLNLLKEAQIPYHTAVGDMWRYADGTFKKSEQFLVDYDLLIKKLNALKDDITLNEFLNTHFDGARYAQTRDALRSFASGYDTADPDKFSAFAMRRELQSEDDEHQYRIKGGYKTMIAYLEQQTVKHGGTIHLSTIVQHINWQPNHVQVISADNREFNAAKVIIALPLGVLQADGGQVGAIGFTPAIVQKQQAIQQMGMGAVIKVLLQFDAIFWDKQAVKKGATADVKHMSYLFSEQAIPTWWTQTPAAIPLLTGWIGGPAADKLKASSNDYILELSLLSLSNIYDITVTELKRKLTASTVVNWTADPFARGSYSYATVAAARARAVLCVPEAETIYFAGEAFYDGPEMGTVEAALATGLQVSALITGT